MLINYLTLFFVFLLLDCHKDVSVHIEELRPIFDEKSDHGNILDQLKQLSFYTDALSECKWSTPKKIITKEISETLINVANNLIMGKNNDMTTEAQLEIYFKHLKPVWKADMFKMKEALIACYQEAEVKGLIKAGTTEGMVKFLL